MIEIEAFSRLITALSLFVVPVVSLFYIMAWVTENGEPNHWW